MATRPLIRLRKLCLGLPEAREVTSWGAPTFRVKTIFAMYSAPDSAHYDDPRASVWLKTVAANQQWLVSSDPDRFFVPPYVGVKGWTGVFLDADTDWAELEELLWDAWRMSVTKTLAARHPPTPPR
jgi:hypothetical protein